MENDIAIKIENVSKSFVLPHEKVNSVKGIFTSMLKAKKWKTKETQRALKNISFEVKKGEFFGIVGRNGSGKSTLLKIIAGIYQPTKGKVSVSGKLVPFIELGVGFNPELTGRENVYLNGAMLGFSRKEIEKMYDDIVEFAELEKFMDQKLKNYSSGMQVRLAFSMATRAKADILLIDEVLAVGDADFQRKCFNYFKDLKKNKKTVVFVSHDMDAIREYCDRAILIDNSILRFKGTPDEISEDYIMLFNPKENTNKTQSNERWGSGEAKIENIKINTGKNIKVDIEILAKTKINNPIVGIQVIDGAGIHICGANNMILKQKIDEFNKNKKIKLSWSIPNIFNTGRYSIDLAITHPDGITQIDWWRDASSFEIVNKASTPHLVAPEILFNLIDG